MPTHLQCMRGLTVPLMPGFHRELHKSWGEDGIHFIRALTVTMYANIKYRLVLQYTAMDRVIVWVDIFRMAADDWLLYNVLISHLYSSFSDAQFVSVPPGSPALPYCLDAILAHSQMQMIYSTGKEKPLVFSFIYVQVECMNINIFPQIGYFHASNRQDRISNMMTSSNGNIFRVTGPLWRESTCLWWFPLQWRGALMFSLIYAWRNVWGNSRDTGDLRRHRAHYNVTVMHN